VSERYRGVLYVHSAIPHVAVEVGRKWFDLRRRVERWLPTFSPECELPAEIRAAQEDVRDRKGFGMFMIEFDATLAEQGRFGLKGWCTRKVTIRSISHVEYAERSWPTSKMARALTGLSSQSRRLTCVWSGPADRLVSMAKHRAPAAHPRR
jgi:hypothetical protein